MSTATKTNSQNTYKIPVITIVHIFSIIIFVATAIAGFFMVRDGLCSSAETIKATQIDIERNKELIHAQDKLLVENKILIDQYQLEQAKQYSILCARLDRMENLQLKQFELLNGFINGTNRKERV